MKLLKQHKVLNIERKIETENENSQLYWKSGAAGVSLIFGQMR